MEKKEDQDFRARHLRERLQARTGIRSQREADQLVRLSIFMSFSQYVTSALQCALGRTGVL